jgi:putative ABC transport system substrate-binding protein
MNFLIKFLYSITVIAMPLVLSAATKIVCISQVVEHPALNQTKQGIIDTLSKEGFVEGENLKLYIETAQASPVLAQQIAAKFVAGKPDVVVGIGTLSAQSLAKAARQGKVNLVFSSITDPVGAGLVQSLEKPGYRISGVSNFIALEPQLVFYQTLLPELKTLGMPYNPSEPNSVKIITQLKALFPVVTEPLMRTADASQSATALSGRCDAFFISNDNTCLAALPAIFTVGRKTKKPVLVSDIDTVRNGALAAMGPNQYAIGVQTGIMIARILRGESPQSMPVEFPSVKQGCINATVAKQLGIVIPESLRNDPGVEIINAEVAL